MAGFLKRISLGSAVKEKEKTEPEDNGRLRCETFDIERVLQHGAHLMGSEGHEYDMDEEALNPAGKYLLIRPVQEIVTSSKPLSSREMNLAKRKARLAFSKQKSRDCSEDGPSAPPTPPVEPDRKKIKLEQPDEFVFEATAPVPDCSGSWVDCTRWPLEAWAGALQAQLFNGASTSRVAGRHGAQAAVVAPVRETCAQTLGVALAQLGALRVRRVAALLAALSAHAQWEARHGALLGFNSTLTLFQEVACESGALEYLIQGLGDSAEDVSAVAAGALAPAAAALGRRRPGAVKTVVARLWRLLADQDDLASPANSYMALLAALMALPEPASMLHPIDLADVLPRLWPYLDHSTSSVRKATLQTLRTLTRPLVTNQPTKNGTDSNGNSDVTNGNNDVTNGEQEQYLNWTPELLQEAMRHIYQRVLFEHVHEIQEIAVQVCGLGELPKVRFVRGDPAGRVSNAGDVAMPGHAARATTRRTCTVTASTSQGYLSCYLVQPAPGIEYKAEDESPIDCYVKVMVVYLRSGSALQRLLGSLVVSSWARYSRDKHMYPPTLTFNGDTGTKENQADNKQSSEEQNPISKLAPPLLASTLHTALNQALYYDEVALNCNRILQEARDLHAMMKHYKLPVDGEELSNILRLEQVAYLTTMSQPLVAAMKLKRVAQTLEERRKNLQAAVNLCTIEQGSLNVSVQAALAGACANLHLLPEKLNPVIRPLMESIKKEPSEELQQNSADTLAVLLSQLVDRDPCPNNKVLVNLKAFLRCDPEYTPRISLENTEETNGDSGSGDSGPEGKGEQMSNVPALDAHAGIVTLWEQQRRAEGSAPRRGRPPAASLAADLAPPHEDEARKLLRIQRRGATLALTSLATYFGEELPEKLPKLWEFITEPLERVMTDSGEVGVAGERGGGGDNQPAAGVGVRVRRAGGRLRARLAPAARAARLARSVYSALRHMAARALAALCHAHYPGAMHALIHEVRLCPSFYLASYTYYYLQVIPALSDLRSDYVRCGAAEALARVVDALQLQIVPYIVLLVVPLLGRMSDHCEAVRIMSTRCFASLIQLMPLDGGIAEPPDLTPELKARRRHDKQFLEQLFNPKSIKDYKIPVPVSAELRSYQQVRHWVFEVNKFIPSKFLKPLQYVGIPYERERLRHHVKNYNFIVASYDIVRKDIDFFSSIKWNYCILDEGHVIKNGKTKVFKAIKQIVANHRLILSGTPIQNNVLELWSLFDFLMPGLLGTERQFTARYSRPILAARDAKATPHQLQAGALACEALHRQVLPFLLRRVKEDVLKELPPKITQDYYCELSPLQRRLYEDLSKEHMPQGITSHHTHVFQALHYLQNVCNHPKLVLTAEHPEARAIAASLQDHHSSLDDINHAAKLPALKQLLLDCGIGTPASDVEPEAVVSQHRALVFCQLKKMLDIVEQDLLKRHLPAVTYLRLDGSVPPHQRHAIVTRFNNDVSIDLLLLTTAVGGLGLNLTGADTVIFVEHDWNPMKDLQAMDRAHRIGQKKVVNVYRLITRDTLEEKIMGKQLIQPNTFHRLQKFKLLTANTVISSENAAMETMGTDQLLDLFNLSSSNCAPQQSSQQSAAGPSGMKSVLETLPDLWDDKQYEEEYDMTNFIKGLNKMST
ncbi:hypothetical protein HF086_015290 [Spodoptera exigua]|uniref:TATA-binding protein-associated factor 172 n=1 Tax=Spodoptera exigua TaxID=7107 RepID=A0A922SBK8_SPOEX|nr:hypothetical protein HF086_015290 [Spodoptera exigua]